MDMKMNRVIEEMERGQQSMNVMRGMIDQRLRVKVEDDVHVDDLEYLKVLDEHANMAFEAFVKSLSLLKRRKVDSDASSDDCSVEERTKNPTAKDRRGCYKRRGIGESKEMEVTQLTDDGFAWRKYGQKVILNTKHPRNYYRCTHKHDQNCQAMKQVQQITDSPPKYKIIYHGTHTCKNTRRTSSIIIDSHEEHSAIFLNFESNSATKKHPQLFPAYPNAANTELKQEQFTIKEEPSVSHSHDSCYDVCNQYPSSSSENQSSFQWPTPAAAGVPSPLVSYQNDEVSVAENYSSTASSYGTAIDCSSMWADYPGMLQEMFGIM